jgi:hypothetical protein
MLNTFIELLRKKSVWLSDLPATIRVPGHGGKPTIDGLQIEEASVDDIAFAIQGLEYESSAISGQLHALKRLHDLARNRGALGTDTVGAIFGGEA